MTNSQRTESAGGEEMSNYLLKLCQKNTIDDID